MNNNKEKRQNVKSFKINLRYLYEVKDDRKL